MQVAIGIGRRSIPKRLSEITEVAPFNIVAPSVSGTPTVNSPVTCNPGNWGGLPAPNIAFQWKRGGVAISPSGTASIYIPQPIDIGAFLTCTVTATNSSGSASLTTVDFGPIQNNDVAPINLSLPHIEGSAVTGSLLTVTSGSWSGSPVPVLSYQWKRDGVAITGETALTYTLVSADVGHQITVTETALNTAGSASATSAATPTVVNPTPPFPPFLTAAPVLSGTPTIGSTLTSTAGSWTAEPDETISYQWQADGYPIHGEIASTYIVQEIDRAKSISCRVTAANSAGSSSANTAVSALVTQAGQTIIKRYIRRVSSGLGNGTSWDNSGTLSNLNAYIAAVGANGQVLIRADEGQYTAQLYSLTGAGVDGAPCIVRGADVNEQPMSALIVGTRTSPWVFGSTTGPEVFRMLAGFKNVTWRNIDFKNCGNGCFRFGADVSSVVIEQCKGTNVQRFIENLVSGVEVSAAVVDSRVSHCRADGFSRAFARLRYASNNWNFNDCFGDSQGQDGDNFAVGIQINDTVNNCTFARCTMRNCIDTQGGDNLQYWNGDGFSQENGNFANTYIDCVAKGCTDGGFDLKGEATITGCISKENKYGFRIWGASLIQDCQFRDPHIRGGTGEQAQLGIFSANGAATLQDCAIVDIDPATAEIFRIDEATAFINASNTSLQKDAGVALISNPNGGGFTLDQKTPPANTVAPAVTGTAQAGSTLSVTSGTWNKTVTIDYQWCRGGLYIDDAEGTTYTLTAADIGFVITCRVFARDASGYVGEAISNATAAVTASLPANVTAPTVQGVPSIGATLTANVGVWSGLPAPTFSYQWKANGVNISGENASTYTVVSGDLGKTISVQVTGANTAGNASVTSAGSAAIVAALSALFVSPAGAGLKNGSSFANAIAIGSIGSAFGAVSAGGFVNLASHLGDYNFTSSINLSRGGTAGNPITFRGVNASLVLTQAVIVGSRTPWTLPVDPEQVTSVSNWTVGNDVFRLNAGADHLKFDHIFFRHVGKGINMGLADIDDLMLLDLTFYNVQEGCFMSHTNDVTNLLAQRIKATGFSKRVFRAFGDSHDWLIEDCEGNAGRQDRDSWSNFIAFDDTAHDITVRGHVSGGIYSGILENCHDTQDGNASAYWNADGISAESGNYNLLIENVICRGCTDGGIDIKAINSTLRGCECYDNKRNYRIWSDFGLVLDNCISRDPFKRGGSGGDALVFIIGGASQSSLGIPDFTCIECVFESTGALRGAYVQDSAENKNVIVRDVDVEYINTTSGVGGNGKRLIGHVGDVTPPTITTAAAFNTFNKQIWTTTLAANEDVSWKIVGGADQAQFTLKDSSGFINQVADRLWMAKKAYNPGGQNAYVVQVEAKDALGNTNTKTITVTVLNQNPPVTFLSNFEGPDNSTATIVDEAGGKNIAFTAGAKLTATTPLQGTSSLFVGGSTQRATVSDHDDFWFTNEFTIKSLIRPLVINGFHTIIGQHNSTGNQRSFRLGVTSLGALDFIYSLNGQNTVSVRSATGLIAINTTYEVMVDRDETGKIRLYIGGVMVASATGAGSLFNSTAQVLIGNTAGLAEAFNGRIDALSVWKNWALAGSDTGYTP